MTWEELTSQEKTALRHLAKGEVQEVPWRQIRRLENSGLRTTIPKAGSPQPGWNSGGRGRRERAAGSDHRRSSAGPRAARLATDQARPMQFGVSLTER